MRTPWTDSMEKNMENNTVNLTHFSSFSLWFNGKEMEQNMWNLTHFS